MKKIAPPIVAAHPAHLSGAVPSRAFPLHAFLSHAFVAPTPVRPSLLE